MYYFKYEGNKIGKYKVIVDRDNLMDLKDEIIKNCTEYKKISQYVLSDNEIIAPENSRNFYSEFIRTEKVKTIDLKDKETNLYYVEYEIPFEIPGVVKYIDRLLDNDASVVDYLLCLRPKFISSNKKERLLNIIKNCDASNINNHLTELEYLTELVKFESVNKHTIPIKEYYEAIANTISFEKVDEIDKELIKENIAFFEQDDIKVKKLENK